MSITEHLKAEIEATAKILNIAPSTVGERAGQGGRFYARLTEGKRVWPETAETVLARLKEMKSKSAQITPSENECVKSHGGKSSADQGQAAS